MQKPIIAIDIDDVLAEFTESVRQRVNESTGLTLTREDYQIRGDYWGYYETVWAQHEAAHSQSIETYVTEMAVSQLHIPMLPGAAFALTRLSEQYNLVCITARPKSLRTATEEWLKENVAELSIEIYFTNHVDVDAPTVSKGEICARVGASYLIDDNVDHCVSAREHGITPILFGEYGWQYTVPEDLVRCRDWPMIIEYFENET